MKDFTAVPEFERCVIADHGAWRVVASEVAYEDPYIRIERARFLTPSRREPVPWTIARRKSAIAVAPRTADGRFVMVRQERLPVRRTLWEFPAGQIDERDNKLDKDVILGTLRRELHEEAGHHLVEASEITPLGYHFSSQGFTDEHVYLFLAGPVDPDPEGNRPDGGEGILDYRPFAIDEIREMIARNEIVDANSLAIFARLSARGLI